MSDQVSQTRIPGLLESCRALLISITAAGALTVAPTSAMSAQTTEFTLSGGALIEIMYFDAPQAGDVLENTLIPAYGNAVGAAGGEYLVGFEILRNLAQDHPATHVAMVQWPNAEARASATAGEAYGRLDDHVAEVAFFAVQSDTPVSLDHSKIYDFTSAWTIGESPEQMGIVMQVIGRYFEKIRPVIEEYEIHTAAFMMRHPSGPDVGAGYAPQITGLFVWNSLDDHARFQTDARWLEHVDIRNAVLARREDVLLGTVID